MREEKWGGRVDDKHRHNFTGKQDILRDRQKGEECVKMEK